jgi:hypothetical protein
LLQEWTRFDHNRLEVPAMYSIALRLLTLAGLLCAVTCAAGDTVQLTNGDFVSGKVVSLDEKNLKLHSEILGTMTIPRDKVASISLGDRAPATAKQTPAVTPRPGQAPAVDDVLKQLQQAGAGGLGGKDTAELQKLVPLLATPQASAMFNEKVQGLMSGKLSIQDIRKDAIKARDQVKDLTKGLGPDADAALAPYLGILDQFIRETDPGRMPKQKK